MLPGANARGGGFHIHVVFPKQARVKEPEFDSGSIVIPSTPIIINNAAAARQYPACEGL
jgi:hypothetical protein